MAFSFVGQNSGAGTGVTSIDLNHAGGTTAGDLVVIMYAFENVNAGSGPWIIPNTGQLQPNGIGPAGAWTQFVKQAPSAAGAGLEVWAAIISTGTHIEATFTTAQNVVAASCTYRGEFNPAGLINSAPPRLAVSQAVTGNQPPSPSVSANVGELVVACAADTMGGSGYGTPSGFTNRVDTARAGAGTVEATIADQTASVAGATGPITFPNAASSSSAQGSTATLVFQPVPASAGVGGIINAGMPEELDIGDGFTLRVTALDPGTGNLVGGVTVSNLIFTADQVAGTPGELEVGPFMLVPGPNA